VEQLLGSRDGLLFMELAGREHCHIEIWNRVLF